MSQHKSSAFGALQQQDPKSTPPLTKSLNSSKIGSSQKAPAVYFNKSQMTPKSRQNCQKQSEKFERYRESAGPRNNILKLRKEMVKFKKAAKETITPVSLHDQNTFAKLAVKIKLTAAPPDFIHINDSVVNKGTQKRSRPGEAPQVPAIEQSDEISSSFSSDYERSIGSERLANSI